MPTEPGGTGPGDASPAADLLREVLGERARAIYGSGARIEALRRLSAGASRETWSFDVICGDETRLPLILKRDPLLHRGDGSLIREEAGLGVDRETEGRLIELAATAQVPVPVVPFYLDESADTTAGFVTERLEGETLGRRILREDAYADARGGLAFECGRAAARIHGIAAADLPDLEVADARRELDNDYDAMSQADHPYPGFEYAFRWLEERLELAGEGLGLVHGDFRNGNLLVDRDGLRGVLDWELAHIGNPASDLGWICVRAWRYGHIKKTVGGFGEIDELLAGYEAGGGTRIDRERIRYWEVFGTLHWGIICITMAFKHIDGSQPSLEKAVIGRRTAETEFDLLELID